MYVVHGTVEFVLLFLVGLFVGRRSSTYALCALMRRCEESAMLSSLSMNSIAKMPDTLEPIHRPSVWRNIRSSCEVHVVKCHTAK